MATFRKKTLFSFFTFTTRFMVEINNVKNLITALVECIAFVGLLNEISMRIFLSNPVH